MYRFFPILLMLTLSACGATGASVPAPAPTIPPSASAQPNASAQPSPSPAPSATAQPSPSPAPSAQPSPTPEPAPTQTVTRPIAPTSSAAADESVVPADIMAKLRADLAQRAGVDDSAISVVSAEAVEWSDSSLGCPQPGMAYMQVITEGYRAMLEAAGVSYDYRVGRSGQFMLCTR